MYRVKIELTAVDERGVVTALTELKRRMLRDLTENHGALSAEYGISVPAVYGLTCKVSVRCGALVDGAYPVGEEG